MRSGVPQGSTTVELDGVAGGGQAPRGSLGIGAARDHEVPREQPRVALIGRRSGGPCVRAEVVVVAAGRQEQRARIVPDDFVEPERTVVEGLGGSEIADVQVHVADRRAGRHPGPGGAACGGHHAAHVERRRRHEQLPRRVAAPRRARPIGIHLDAEAVRIRQVDRFADRVIRRSSVDPERAEVRDESSERRAIGQQDREVIETEESAARYRLHAWLFHELDQRTLFSLGARARPALRSGGARRAPARVGSTRASGSSRRPAAAPRPTCACSGNR